MWFKWFPWRYVIKRAARAHGFLDPFLLLTRFSLFAQPSEVLAPLELLRSAVVLHARGLINSQAIQHNLDWVWPYWIVCQFDPHNAAFVPRAFSLTHINLTHRNWTAVGLPDCEELPIVDPRGLLTPFWDSWSITSWIITDDGQELLPAREKQAEQRLQLQGALSVTTKLVKDRLSLQSKAEVIKEDTMHLCRLEVTGLCDKAGWLIVSLRPYNPEGVSFIHNIRHLDDKIGWLVNGKNQVYFDRIPERRAFSMYTNGDVYRKLFSNEKLETVTCKVGMASAAFLFRLEPNVPRGISVRIPLKSEKAVAATERSFSSWENELEGICQLKVPHERIQFLYDSAIRTILIHSAKELFAGPYTYRRFWFRDAAFIVHAMLCLGMVDRSEKIISRFPKRQTVQGYFLSQEGEWDSNGEALWIIRRFYELTARKPTEQWKKIISRAGRWIQRKRLSPQLNTAHAGLLASGFSAEHLGPNDYYYWDNFWGVAGLKAAAYLMRLYQDEKAAQNFETEAKSFLSSINLSLEKVATRLGDSVIPASPYRRMDSGAIGSLAGGYPLQILNSQDHRLLKTVEYLMKECLVDGGFFHDLSHSGINPYLTLHIAQVLLRAGDMRFWDLAESLARLASPTGQWPEAIHPKTKGGCMGDGQHVWAAAEWIVMLRNCFVREEGDHLILCSGIPPRWFWQKAEFSLGPTLTSWGKIAVTVKSDEEKIKVSWNTQWHKEPPSLIIHLSGFSWRVPEQGQTFVELSREEKQ